MVRDPAEVLKAALALSTEARAALIDSLIESLDHTIDDDAEEGLARGDLSPSAD